MRMDVVFMKRNTPSIVRASFGSAVTDVAVMTAHWEAFGVLTFPKPTGVAEWRDATVDAAACKVVEKLARGATGTVWVEVDVHPAYVLTVAATPKLANLVKAHRAIVSKALA